MPVDDKSKNLEQFEAAPVPATAELSRIRIKNQEFESSYEPLSKAEYADAQWNDLSKGIDNASLPEDPNRKTSLSPDEYEEAQYEYLNKEVDQYGQENSTEMEINNESIVLLEEVNRLIEELLAEIGKAREQMEKLKGNRATQTLFPIIGAISGFFKGRKFKKMMAKVNEVQTKLQDKSEELKQRVEMDNISPDLSNKMMLASGVADVGALFSAVGSLSNCALVFGGASGLLDLYGTEKAFESHEQLIRADIKLEDVEKQLQGVQKTNLESIENLRSRRDYYREGAIENIKGLAA